MIASHVIEMLTKMAQDHPNVSSQINAIQHNFRESMWHVITDQLYALTMDHEFDNDKDLIPFFDNFIKNLAKKINHLKFVRIAHNCSRQFESKNSK